MKPFAVLGWIVLFVVAAYCFYTFIQASNAPKTVHIDTTEDFRKAPPVICAISNSAGLVNGTLRIFHSAARFDVVVENDIERIPLHLIVSHDDNAYAWQDGHATGATGSYQTLHSMIGLGAVDRIECSPWWIPSGDLFIAPQSVKFGQGTL